METLLELILLALYVFTDLKWSKRSITSVTTADFVPYPTFLDVWELVVLKQ